MGMAEVVPGVSGGTIALITGIYEELITTIKSFDIAALGMLMKGNFKELATKINVRFLLSLMLGMVVGIVIGIFLISYLLENHSEILWGFFFGLVLASSVYIAKQIKQWNVSAIVFLVLGTIFSYFITVVTPATGTESLWVVFLSGVLAISALILPGISGSFILLLLGMYSIIIPNIKELLSSPNSKSLLIVVVFGLGCAIGLMTFSRVLSYLFNNYKNTTFACLTGFMLGSLNKIWPWRNPQIALNEETLQQEIFAIGELVNLDFEHYKILKEANVLPAGYFNEPYTIAVIGAFVAGLLIIFVFDRFQKAD